MGIVCYLLAAVLLCGSACIATTVAPSPADDAHTESDGDSAADIGSSYVARLLRQFGDGLVLSVEDLEHLMVALGLGDLVHVDSAGSHEANESSVDEHRHHEHGHQHTDHDHSPRSQHDHELCLHCGDGGSSGHGHAEQHANESEHDDHGLPDASHNQSSNDVTHRPKRSPVSSTAMAAPVSHHVEHPLTGCGDAASLLSEHALSSDRGITADGLKQLCPALLHRTANRHSCVHRPHQEPYSVPPLSMWLYATVAVTVISLCGLLGVAVVPIMQRMLYKQLLQFLVALAVGTLTGDALLHLLPHALVPHGDSHNDHGDSHGGHDDFHGDHGHHSDTERQAVLKGLTALVALLVFFLSERLLAMIQGHCGKQRRKRINERLADMTSLNRQQTEMIERKMKAYRNAPGANHCLADTETANFLASMHDSHHSCDAEVDVENHNSNNGHTSVDSSRKTAADPVRSDVDTKAIAKDPAAAGGSSSPVPPAADQLAAVASGSATAAGGEDSCERFSAQERVPRSNDFTVIIHEHEHRHHGHTHTHGHIHQPAGSLQAAAGMVIVGDGLHNFTDGLAIGAAFAGGGLAGGISTSVAVFCHELPHEIGDFAVLLKSGMSVRLAVFYNMVSSVLCLAGMVAGMLLGNIESFNSWVFAFAAGSFLYIALVDMIPELALEAGDDAAVDSGGPGPGTNLLLQLLGMSLGAGIMMLIAIYEHDLHSIVAVL